VLLLSICVIVFLYIFSFNFQRPKQMDIWQRLVVETLSPFMDFVQNISKSADQVIKDYVLLRQLHEENERLKAKVTHLQQQITSYHEAYIENLRLRRLLDFKNTIPTRTIAAQVVLHAPTGWFETLVIDKGSRDGVVPDMALVNDEGIVGRVLNVSDRYSQVLLITDPESAVDALIQRNRVRGILKGKDLNTCVLNYVRSNLDVQTGDLVVTSGKDGIFPKGLRLGIVQKVSENPVNLFLEIEVKPLVRLGTLEEVLILATKRIHEPGQESDSGLGS
jgi:rod shape-determining protein MreC